jgi:hypothetical protein
MTNNNNNNNIKVVYCTKEHFDIFIARRPSRFVIKKILGPCGPPYKWANPFVMDDEKDGTKKDGTREEVIEKYRKWLLSNPELLKQLPELCGKKLGCWCKPLPCHGDVLKELAERQQSLKGE